MTSNANHPCSTVLPVLELFEEALDGVRFPDIDAPALRASCERLAEAQAMVVARQAELKGAQAAVEQERTEVQKLARRALEYARIFASDNPALLERIEAITPPGDRPKRKRKPKKKPLAAAASQDAELDAELAELEASDAA